MPYAACPRALTSRAFKGSPNASSGILERVFSPWLSGMSNSELGNWRFGWAGSPILVDAGPSTTGAGNQIDGGVWSSRRQNGGCEIGIGRDPACCRLSPWLYASSQVDTVAHLIIPSRICSSAVRGAEQKLASACLKFLQRQVPSTIVDSVIVQYSVVPYPTNTHHPEIPGLQRRTGPHQSPCSARSHRRRHAQRSGRGRGRGSRNLSGR
jgi:hypothetical protein